MDSGVVEISARCAKERATTRKSILCLGATVDAATGQVSGQTMMFRLLIDALIEAGDDVRVIDVTEKIGASQTTSRVDGKPGWRRINEYLKVLPGLWKSLLTRDSILYITSAQSLWGFLRDAAVIWPASLFRRPVIAQQFGANYGTFYDQQNSLMKFIIKKTLSRVTTIVVEGDLVKQQLSFLPGWKSQVRVIPNGLPDRSIKGPDAPKTVDPTQPFTILYLSNLVETKGYWDVLEAVLILAHKRKRKVCCRFVGRFLAAGDSIRFPDPEAAREEFWSFIESHELTDVVSHTDFLFGPEKIEAYQASHVFILPSNYVNEGQPVSVLEAMASGLVVIATEYRLIPLMVSHGQTGFFVKYGNPEEIASRIEFLMDDPHLYEQMSRNSIRKFHEEFSSDLYISRMLSLFEEAH